MPSSRESSRRPTRKSAPNWTEPSGTSPMPRRTTPISPNSSMTTEPKQIQKSPPLLKRTENWKLKEKNFTKGLRDTPTTPETKKRSFVWKSPL
jgi:hypothetical protein